MIVTGCEGCCFLKKEDKDSGCIAQQLCTIKDGKVIAPGYCRICRSHKWAKKQNVDDLAKLYGIVIQELALTMDLIVIFDEANNQIRDLEKTLGINWYKKYTQKIIIADITGFGNRQNIALQYIKNRKHSIPIVVDSSVINESANKREETIRRLSKQITAPFFLVIPAGKIIRHFDTFAAMIQHLPSRVIHWSFPFMLGSTTIIPQLFKYGLFITTPYKALTKYPIKEQFTQLLRTEEEETEMRLSWFCPDCHLI